VLTITNGGPPDVWRDSHARVRLPSWRSLTF
jgi:hypothetical protein